SQLTMPGCFAGTQTCTSAGTWGPCVGGAHATDGCATADHSGCHLLTALPYAAVSLKSGTGTFSSDAIPGSESFTVTCPAGPGTCPAVAPPDQFQPLQSGEYSVQYKKMVAGNPNPATCTFPLVVAATGLRVELTWEHAVGDLSGGADLDLHLHQPNDTHPWAINPAAQEDCAWSSCTINQFASNAPAEASWFPDAGVPPAAVSWDLQPLPLDN